MFDLDADPQSIHARLGESPLLRPLIAARPGLRLPGGWDGAEVAIRAILGQQVSVAAATTLARRLVEAHGRMLPQPPGPKLHSVFPALSELGAMEADALAGSIRLPRKRAAAIIEVARALQAGLVSFEPTQSLEEFIRAWTALPGIGDWTAHYMAMRGWGHPDAFPAGDLVLRQQAARQLSEASVLTERQMLKLAEPWQPWRAYAVIHVWNAAS